MGEPNCLRCGKEMKFDRQTKIQLGQTGFLLGDLSNLVSGALAVDIYHCPNCGKLEFFLPGFAACEDDGGEEGMDELPPEADRNIIGVSMDGVPQVSCPACGRSHDFDYPRCPFCEYEY